MKKVKVEDLEALIDKEALVNLITRDTCKIYLGYFKTILKLYSDREVLSLNACYMGDTCDPIDDDLAIIEIEIYSLENE